jgi:hypothetical protein
MQRLTSLLFLITLFAASAVIYGGHEMPVYPSYYPQEIRIETVEPQAAAQLLPAAKIHAYVGDGRVFEKPISESIGYVDSLGAYLVLILNRASVPMKDRRTACELRDDMLQSLSTAQVEGFVFHPYPVNPFHGDYLQHYDLAQTARKRYLDMARHGTPQMKVKAEGALATELVARYRQPNGSEWDATVAEISVARLLSSQRHQLNGWLGPPWSKQGWFQAYLLLDDSLHDPKTKERVEVAAQRLRTGDHQQPEETLNLERELISLLTSDCYTTVVGYTTRREYFNTDFSAGIENIAYDSHAGLNSAIFVRTVKLKDFPWNGWLRLGIDGSPAAAWNPIAGFTDEAGQLIWWALGDPALFPAPYADGWELNRIVDVQESQ